MPNIQLFSVDPKSTSNQIWFFRQTHKNKILSSHVISRPLKYAIYDSDDAIRKNFK